MTRSSDQVRFAVVGCGHIGKRHAEMISGIPKRNWWHFAISGKPIKGGGRI
jgi:predicted dehydrogenase